VNLRPYQQDAVDQLRKVWRRRPLLQLATGGGKTCIAAEIIRGALARNRRSLIVAHTREIVLQTARRFSEYGFDVSTILAGEPTRASMVYCGSIQTLNRRELPEIDVLIIDEAHHANSPSWKSLIDSYPNAAVIGLTATPVRLDGRGLAEAGFGAIIQGAPMEALIADGFLVRPRIYTVPVGSMDGAKVTAGDFAQSSLDSFSSTITGDIVEHYIQFANRTLAIVFACSIQHSLDITAAFNNRGIAAEHVDGSYSKEARSQIIDRLSDARTLVISNCSLFGEGWDLPVLETAILARPTLSIALYRQQCGRVLRSSPGKSEAVIIDHAGNFLRHGSPLDELDWDLNGKPKRPSNAPPPGKSCPECFVVMPAASTKCPECGYQFEIKPREPEHVEGQLVEAVDDKAVREAVYANLCQTAFARGYKIGWARNQYRNRYHRWPKNMKVVELDNYPCTNHIPERTAYGTRCERCYRT